MAPAGGSMLSSQAGPRTATAPGLRASHGLLQTRAPSSPPVPGMAKGMSPTMARAMPQGEVRALRNPLAAASPGHGGGGMTLPGSSPSARQGPMGSGLLQAVNGRGSYRPPGAGAGGTR